MAHPKEEYIKLGFQYFVMSRYKAKRVLSPLYIIRKTSEELGVPVEIIRREIKSGKRPHSDARKISIYLTLKYHYSTLWELGSFYKFGHSSVLWAKKEAIKLMESDDRFREKLLKVEGAL